MNSVDRWSVCLFLPNIATFHNSPNIKSWNSEIACLSPKDMKSSEVLDTEDHITKDGLESNAAKLVETGALLIAMSSGILHYSIEVGALRMPLPPIDEQRAIVSHINAETAKLDALRAATARTIALLKKRRAALIAAAVTGKLDVLGAERHLDVVAD
jgi:hypothetical protein